MRSILSWFHRAWLVLVVAGVVILLDQWTKSLVRVYIPEYTAVAPFPALRDFVSFEHVRNYGAAFGILQNQSLMLTVIAVVVSVGILFYLRYLPTNNWVIRVLLGLQLGGALGNLIDRFQRGYVTDYIKTGIPGVYYIPNYNVADASIVIGVLGLALYIIVMDIRSQRREKQAAGAEAPHPDA